MLGLISQRTCPGLLAPALQVYCGLEDVQVLLNGPVQGYVVVMVNVPEGGFGCEELVANSQTVELEQPRSGPPLDPQSAMPVRASITVPGRTSGLQMSVFNFEEETVSTS
jgi:hypothetical protein